MKNKIDNSEHGSGLVVVISVVATILILLGAAVSFTAHISRMSQRTRKTALAMEIADGHLEYLFTNWRNIYRKTWTTTSSGGTDDVVLATNYFFTSCPTWRSWIQRYRQIWQTSSSASRPFVRR